ncbi:hypothetical protein AAHH78_36505, partial [Burkholderia pseudomallei]
VVTHALLVLIGRGGVLREDLRIGVGVVGAVGLFRRRVLRVERLGVVDLVEGRAVLLIVLGGGAEWVLGEGGEVAAWDVLVVPR